MVDKPYANAYYDSEKLFAECVKKSMAADSKSVGKVISQPTYQIVWNAFIKWVGSQVELGRVITIPLLGTIGQHSQDEKQKFYYLMLSDSFKSHYGLNFKIEIEADFKAAAISAHPSIKLSYQALSKDCGQGMNGIYLFINYNR